MSVQLTPHAALADSDSSRSNMFTRRERHTAGGRRPVVFHPLGVPWGRTRVCPGCSQAQARTHHTGLPGIAAGRPGYCAEP